MKFLNNIESMWLLRESIGELVDKSTEPYDNHLTWIRAVKSDLDRAGKEFESVPGNGLVAKQVQLFHSQILEVFLRSWFREQTLEPMFIGRFKKLLLAGFNEIILSLNHNSGKVG